MRLYTNELYKEDVDLLVKSGLPWERLENTVLLISGATGLLGSYLIDVIMTLNMQGLNCRIKALGRSERKAAERFSRWWGDRDLQFIQCDFMQPFSLQLSEDVDYVLHLASNTHPLLYSGDPIGTIMINFLGLQNLLEFSLEHGCKRFVYGSSVEIYGENRGDTELFAEDYCGYLDSNTLRAGYPESKRCGEALCQAYIAQKSMDIVIPRFTRSYGPTIQMADSKALSQFMRNGVEENDIVLKSAGTQTYSYTYMADAVSGMMHILFNGECGEAYNISDESSNVSLRDLAGMIADYVGKQVIFEIPDEAESAGYSRATKALPDGAKLKKLGWKPFYTIKEAVPRTIDILKFVYKENPETGMS